MSRTCHEHENQLYKPQTFVNINMEQFHMKWNYIQNKNFTVKLVQIIDSIELKCVFPRKSSLNL